MPWNTRKIEAKMWLEAVQVLLNSLLIIDSTDCAINGLLFI